MVENVPHSIMNVNKKFDRFKQWAGERMGAEAKTSVSDDFKALEEEMNRRHEGMDRMQKSMTAYVKAISKRNEGDDKEKVLPIAHLGSSMVSHGERDFDMHSEFGQSLILSGRTQERLARVQETYQAQATSSWLESMDRSLVQMKEYQAARKKLENRRLAYDASLAKMQKAKKEDFRVEEELRTQKAKYEEASEDVYRRMQDIKDAEVDSIADLTTFMDAELNYHERCREVLLQLKNEWPASQAQSHTPGGRRPGRPRSNTAHSFHDRYEAVEEEPRPPVPELRTVMKASRAGSSNMIDPPRRDFSPEPGLQRPALSRAGTFEGPTQLRKDMSPGPQRLTRVPSDTFAIRMNRTTLRSVSTVNADVDVDSPDDTASYWNNSPDRSHDERSVSPSPSRGSIHSRTASSTTVNSVGFAKKGPPPPPPPSRSKKPPPPPLPTKRTLVSAVEM